MPADCPLPIEASGPRLAEDVDAVRRGLMAFNARTLGPREPEVPLAFVVRDADGEVRGGVVGETRWGWLAVDLLWVDEALRGQGYGTRLMAAAEEEAVRRGCRHAYLDTIDFQARPFYERLGYRVFGEQTDFPPGHRRWFLQKRLAPG